MWDVIITGLMALVWMAGIVILILICPYGEDDEG